jgi:thioredoxin reductase (NADPH)
MVEVAVLGAGVAGLTAALFAARLGCSTLVVAGDELGGELLNVSAIEDFPGFVDGVSGYELCPTLQEQAQRAGARFEATKADSIEREGDGWLVRTATGSVAARSVVVCTGARFRPLGVPGEQELLGKGVSHCAACDGPIFSGGIVAVVGGGDSGLQEALELARHASKVLVLERSAALGGQQVYRDRLAVAGNVETVVGVEVDEIVGEGRVGAVVAHHRSSGERRRYSVDAVFVYGGLDPVAPSLPELGRDKGGHLVTDGHCRTSLPGVLAAGGIRAGFPGQAVIAAGDGATAALAAGRFLRDGAWPFRGW